MKIGSLFAGIGGIDLAFRKAGYEISFANEADKYACEAYRKNFHNMKLFECDIRTLDPKLLPDADVITAGFPCQPFSVCGKQKGFGDDRGNLFFEIMRIADVKNPDIIFLENVANLVEHDKGRTFNAIHNELVSRDYIIRYTVADACDYGIPQHRTRTYIVAFKSPSISASFQFPEKIKNEKRIFDVIDKGHKENRKYYLDENSRDFKSLSQAIKDDNQIYRFSDYGIQASKEGISFTLKANMGTWYNRVPYIKDNFGIRKITPCECLSLQGFPGYFVFPDIPLRAQYKQSGNTVCVPIVEMIAKEIKKAVVSHC